MSSIANDQLATALWELLREAYFEPGDSGFTWFTDNEPGSGFLGTVEKLSAEEASTVPFEGGDTIAAHCNHVAYYLSLANRSFQGENAFAEADWKASWEIQSVNETGWQHLREQLAVELDRALGILARGVDLSRPELIKGSMALLAHGAWHLGAARQLVAIVKDTNRHK
jgi:exonuclease VII small subunit